MNFCGTATGRRVSSMAGRSFFSIPAALQVKEKKKKKKEKKKQEGKIPKKKIPNFGRRRGFRDPTRTAFFTPALHMFILLFSKRGRFFWKRRAGGPRGFFFFFFFFFPRAGAYRTTPEIAATPARRHAHHQTSPGGWGGSFFLFGILCAFKRGAGDPGRSPPPLALTLET